GTDGDLHPPHVVGDLGEHRLHLVVVPHAHATAREQRVARRYAARDRVAHRVALVACDTEVDRVEARLREQGEQDTPVRVPDLTGSERTSELHELVAGREHADTGAGHDIDLGDAHAG